MKGQINAWVEEKDMWKHAKKEAQDRKPDAWIPTKVDLMHPAKVNPMHDRRRTVTSCTNEEDC